jgi:dipeptidyl aminopeptidase/acylaminoacyl peptidase
MGGFISIFKASADFRVKALSLWATPSHLGDKRDVEDTETPPLGEAFYQDLEQYDAGQAIKKVDKSLILHGEADELVPLTQAEELYAAARAPKHLEVFPGGDHRFTDPQHRRQAIRMSLEWFQRYL